MTWAGMAASGTGSQSFIDDGSRITSDSYRNILSDNLQGNANSKSYGT